MSKTIDQGKEEVAALCRYFATNHTAFLAPGVKEAHVRQSLIDPLFEALGWDVGNKAMIAPQYREIIPEDSLEVEGQQKAPDYTFRVGTLPKFYVEAKKCGVNIGADAAPAFQLRRYGWSAKLALSILTDFEELAVYDCTVRPRPNDKASYARIRYFRYDEYPDRWSELWDVFSREAVWSGAFDQYAASKRKRGTSEVDAEFLKEMEGWRLALAGNIALRNKNLSLDDLNAAVQLTIDRVVFLRMAEDRGLESYEQLLKLCERPNIYPRFIRDMCRKADQKYNSGLFHFEKESGVSEDPDRITPKLAVDDKVFKPILENLYFAHGSPYHFGVLPVEILGTVYERFLGKVIRLTAGHQARIEDKPEVRKAGGVYYTPAYIVEYIVKHTVAVQIGGRSPAQLAGATARAPFRVLDMACGSGSFLLGAYQCLLDYCLNWYIGHNPESFKKAVYKDPRNGHWRLTIEEKKRILTTHIFGVDIDRQAVEVSKLSLLLKVLEGETDQSLSLSQLPFGDRALPNLANNIKCGNSLVGPDYFIGKMFPDPEEMKRVNAFDWKQEFPQAMKAGGFDSIIGNPPYSYRNATEDLLRDYYVSRFLSTEGNFDLYKFFLERSTELTRDLGIVGFIVSATFLVQPTFSKLRKLLLDRMALVELAPLGPRVFTGATVDTSIIIAKKLKSKKHHLVRICTPSNPIEIGATAPYHVRQSRFGDNANFSFDYKLSEGTAAIVSALFVRFPPIERGFEFGVGINTGFIREELTAPTRKNEFYHRMVPGSGIARYGAVSNDGWIMYSPDYVRRRGKLGRSLPPERFFKQEKILVVRTRNLSLPRRIIATIDRSGSYNLNRLTNIIARPRYSLLGLLGILNSTLFNWLFSTRYFDYEIKPAYLRGCPLADCDENKLVRNVERMLALHHQLTAAKSEARRATIQRQIDATDAEIDRLVYDLYGLTAEEIAMVEEASAKPA